MELRDRFMRKVLLIPFTDCWIWTASMDQNGYGRIGTGDGKTDYAHRVSWSIHHAPVPARTMVCHTCDTPYCVNPAHLFLGTNMDNMRDAARKGRIRIPARSYMSDERHQPAKLTNDDVRAIRASGDSAYALSKAYGVSHKAAWLAKTGKTFKGVM